jgi:hypothetical protein
VLSVECCIVSIVTECYRTSYSTEYSRIRERGLDYRRGLSYGANDRLRRLDGQRGRWMWVEVMSEAMAMAMAMAMG